MPTKCFIVDAADSDGVDTDAQKQPGAMWEIPTYGPGGEYRDFAMTHMLSAEYRRDRADRNPVCVRLPDGTPWNVDQAASASGPGGPGWTVTGEMPSLTARPSVDTGTYHGWLTDGVLSDDLEGRTYG